MTERTSTIWWGFGNLLFITYIIEKKSDSLTWLIIPVCLLLFSIAIHLGAILDEIRGKRKLDEMRYQENR